MPSTAIPIPPTAKSLSAFSLKLQSDRLLARLGEATREAETIGIPWEVDETKPTAKHILKERRINIGPRVAAALRLLILTGARLRELLGLKWDYVDFERELLLLPDSK